jgi:putative addiction module component (TIGR02574 family)
MTFTVEQIRTEALRLSAEDRARLAGELIESLDEIDEVDQAAVDAAWREEVRRRIQDSSKGNIELLNGDDFMLKLRQRFKR